MKLRLFLVVGLLLLIGVSIGAIFWRQELKYALPTPIPTAYVPVMVQTRVLLPTSISEPLFLHFFNPDCPCSRFNRTYFNQLLFQYSQQIDFRVVIPPYASIEETRKFFDREVTIVVDSTGWARSCGVYATPQAVIIDRNHQLYYRGNYNRSRYCTDPGTNYAEQALKAFLRQEPPPAFDPLATRAYGCSYEEEI